MPFREHYAAPALCHALLSQSCQRCLELACAPSAALRRKNRCGNFATLENTGPGLGPVRCRVPRLKGRGLCHAPRGISNDSIPYSFEIRCRAELWTAFERPKILLRLQRLEDGDADSQAPRCKNPAGPLLGPETKLRISCRTTALYARKTELNTQAQRTRCISKLCSVHPMTEFMADACP